MLKFFIFKSVLFSVFKFLVGKFEVWIKSFEYLCLGLLKRFLVKLVFIILFFFSI